ncbi:MAG: CotH kinase family protein [Bryobacterales bacterium]|nr:CotH kinase family protein [Bryobacterales bacterium]
MSTSSAILLFTLSAALLPAQRGPGRGPGGPGGFPPMGMSERKLVKDFDKDGDGKLNATERQAARASLNRRNRPEPGPALTPDQVKQYTSQPLYDRNTLRTLFLTFESKDWEQELADFHNSDVEVPADLLVDGKAIPGVGVHFRGASSFMMVGEGQKRSLNLSIDYTDSKARLGGYRTLNLLNSNGDPTLLRTLLYAEIGRHYVPIPKVNYMRVVINGESWGIYVNVQQFNSDFLSEWFPSSKGARWKTPGSPMGRAGLDYIGDDPAAYKRLYEIKTKDDPKDWAALIQLCKTLKETPPDKLEAALAPMLDIDGALKFLALEKALINSDGYWTRASDYNLFLDNKGRFHVIPHDFNEALAPAEMMGPPPGFGGPPMGGPPMGGPRPRAPQEADLDIFAGEKDPAKPLLHKLLAVPALREKYVAYIKDIATNWLDWQKLEPIVQEAQALIAADVKTDTRKLGSIEAFLKGAAEEVTSQGFGPFGGRPQMSIKTFVEKRRAFLLSR